MLQTIRDAVFYPGWRPKARRSFVDRDSPPRVHRFYATYYLFALSKIGIRPSGTLKHCRNVSLIEVFLWEILFSTSFFLRAFPIQP